MSLSQGTEEDMRALDAQMKEFDAEDEKLGETSAEYDGLYSFDEAGQVHANESVDTSFQPGFEEDAMEDVHHAFAPNFAMPRARAKRASVSPDKAGSGSSSKRRSGRGRLESLATRVTPPTYLAQRPRQDQSSSATHQVVRPNIEHLKVLKGGKVANLSSVVPAAELNGVLTAASAYIDAWVDEDLAKATRWFAGEKWTDVCMRRVLLTNTGNSPWYENADGINDMERACSSCPNTSKGGATRKKAIYPCIRRWDVDVEGEPESMLVLLPDGEGNLLYWL